MANSEVLAGGGEVIFGGREGEEGAWDRGNVGTPFLVKWPEGSGSPGTRKNPGWYLYYVGTSTDEAPVHQLRDRLRRAGRPANGARGAVAPRSTRAKKEVAECGGRPGGRLSGGYTSLLSACLAFIVLPFATCGLCQRPADG